MIDPPVDSNQELQASSPVDGDAAGGGAAAVGRDGDGARRPRLEARLDPRRIILARIAKQAARWPVLELGAPDVKDLADRDRRLAIALYAETIRRWLTLEHLLNTRLQRPMREMEPKMQAALLVGACQLYFFDQVPDHAAINETVEWARRAIRPGAGGLANAVLRRLADTSREVVGSPGDDPRRVVPRSDGRFILLADPVFPVDTAERLAAQTSHPTPLVRRWIERHGEAGAQALVMHNLVVAPVILAGVPEADITAENNLKPHDESGFAVFTGGQGDLVRILDRFPTARVQDPASAAPVAATASLDPAPRLIVDVCAGSGTKTHQLAFLHPKATIIATDVDEWRLARLRERFARFSPTSTPRGNVEIVNPRQLVDRVAGKADLVVIDVPCSNSGVFARRLEARYRLDPDHLESLIDIQRQLLADAMRLRAPGGRILYCTCSLEREENEDHVPWMRRWHNLRALTEGSRKPAGLPGHAMTAYHDGSYHVILG